MQTELIVLNLGGTYRAISPEDTLKKIEPLLWTRFGITRVANVTGLDDIDIPTYVAIRPQSTFLSTSQGKGATHALAKVSAAMESIEGWHAERPRAPELCGSFNELSKSHHLVRLRPEMNSGILDLDDINSRDLLWGKGLELNTQKELYIPYSLINVNMSGGFLGAHLFPATTNGLASGNTYNEAVCHGLFEVIEREAECRAQQNSKNISAVNQDSIKNIHLRELINHIEERSLELLIVDKTSYVGVPTFTAYLSDKESIRSVGAQRGSGTHLSSVVALSRAITEAIQTRLTVISGARDDVFPTNYKKEKYGGLQQLKESFSKKTIDFWESKTPESLEGMLNKTLNFLQEEGTKEVIVYNHSRKELPISVVHVVVPDFKFDFWSHKNDG